MVKIIISCLAILGFFVGVLFFLSPIPIGILIMSVSLGVLICVNGTARKRLKILRTRYESLNAKIHTLENKIENKLTRLSNALEQTRPNKTKVGEAE